MKVTYHKTLHVQGNPFVASVESEDGDAIQAQGTTKQLAKEALLDRLHREKEKCQRYVTQLDKSILAVIKKKV